MVTEEGADLASNLKVPKEELRSQLGFWGRVKLNFLFVFKYISCLFELSVFSVS